MLEFHFCVAMLDFGLSPVRQVQYLGGVGLSLLRGRCIIRVMLEFHFWQVQFWVDVGISLLRGNVGFWTFPCAAGAIFGCWTFTFAWQVLHLFEKATTVIGGGCAVAVFGVIAHCPQVQAISTHNAPDGSRYSSTDVT